MIVEIDGYEAGVRVGVDAGDDHTKLTATFNLMASSFMVGIVPTNNGQEMKDPGVRILLDYEACRSVLHRRAAILSHACWLASRPSRKGSIGWGAN